jgi:hypothetical protein
MHADAAPYIAYSGEMFVRRIGTEGWEVDEEEEQNAQADTAELSKDKKKTKASRHPPRHPPSAYELVIDNNSGTYRPHKELLPLLAEFLGGDANIGAYLFSLLSISKLIRLILGGPGGIGKITAMDGFDEGLKDTKKRRAKAKNNVGGRDGGEKRQMVQVRRGCSVSSIGSMSSDEVEAAVREGQEGQEAEGNEGVGKKVEEGKGKVEEEKGKMKEMKEGVAGIVEEGK